ncbi:MAG: hypothetical protein C4318_04225 [Acidimicrobiia bacterium]
MRTYSAHKFRSNDSVGLYKSSESEAQSDTGSVTVEFLASLVLLVVVLVVSIDIGIFAYVRNLVHAAAAEAARTAAPYGTHVSSAKVRIDQLLPDVVGEYSRALNAYVREDGDFVEVEVQGEFVPSAPFLPRLPLRAKAWAFREEKAVQRR